MDTFYFMFVILTENLLLSLIFIFPNIEAVFRFYELFLFLIRFFYKINLSKYLHSESTQLTASISLTFIY